jgi:hypothetical protein
VNAAPPVAATGIVWLASYPKSGNTWVRLFLNALERGIDELDFARPEASSRMASDRGMIERHLDLAIADFSWEEAAELRPLAYRALAKTPGGPVLVKVHDERGLTPAGAPLFPAEATLACVHLVRDPRDVCLSLAAHNGASIDKTITTMGDAASATGAASKTQMRERRGSWSSHGESWLAAPFPRLTLRYEDIVADPLHHLGAIARFRGIEATPEAIARAVAAADFSKLAAREAETGFRERPPGMARFFRAGKPGQWRDALSPDQIARIERDHGALMRRFGYERVTDAPLNRSCPGASG